VAASAWLQRCHERLRLIRDTERQASDELSPTALLAEHWPKVVAILMPLLPGAVGTVLQAMAHVP